MSVDEQLLSHFKALEDPARDIKTKPVVATEIRDSIDVWCQAGTPTYAHFLEKGIPIFLKILDGPPVFNSTAPEQKLRSCILEIIHRLPMTQDITEPIASEIVEKLIQLIRVENEDNDILIVKTVLDFLRHSPKIMKEKVQSFLDTILEMFDMTENTVKEMFDNPTQNGVATQSPKPSSPVTTSAADLGNELQQTRHLQKGMQSFKVLAECPIIVVSLFANIDRTVVVKNVKAIVPLIKKTLLLQAGPQDRAHEEAKARGEHHLGVCKEIKNKAAFGDLIMMQVKTMGFLAYLLRVYSGQLTDFLPALPDIVVRMLKDCPRERSAVRKELLVAIRHIINFNFRKIFLRKLDDLLDASILIGDGLTVYETMRPLAYSMLADLIHHLREKLTKDQISKTIKVYIKNFLDDFPGTSFQTMSAKLLINMAEYIAKCKPRQDARHYFMLIFTAIADKFAAMNAQFPLAIKLADQPPVQPGEIVTESYMAEKDHPPEWRDLNILHASPIKTQAQRERISNMVEDNKFLLKNLVQGLKTLFSTLKHTNPAALKLEPEAQLPPNWAELSWGFSAEEVQIFIRLFHEGIQAFRYYDPTGGLYSSETKGLSTAELVATQYMANGPKEEKELLETFGTVFHYIDPATFHEIFHSEIPHLYEMCFVHPPLLHVAQFLLASEATSPNFCGMLLQFLMGKIDEVGVADPKKASTLLRLFKLSFMAVTLFAPQNEQVLLPHITTIITKAIQLSTTAEEPINCFLLLRSLFRSIGGGKFELLYKEILPLLEMILDVLNGLLHSARKPQDRDLFVELILTVPARLSNLLPHLRYLMRPLIVALGSGSDLVGQGLRTLELCVDNLTQDYIDPIMAPFIDDLMATLWGHLKPAPYNHFHSHTTTRILGKLGGRNRKFLTGIYNLNYKPYSDDDWSFDVKLIGSTKDRAFPATVGIDYAIAKLKENPAKIKDQSKIPAAKASDPYYKHNAFQFIQSQVKLYIGLDNLPDDFAQLVRLQAADLLANKTDVGEDFYQGSAAERSVPKRDAEHNILKKLLQACLYAQSIPELQDEATAFTSNLCRHFTLLEIGKTYATLKHRSSATLETKSFDPLKTGEGPLFIDSQVLADALTESLASDCPDERESAEKSILDVWENAAIVFGERTNVDRLMFWVSLVKNFTHACYQPEWYTKMSGVLGIKILLTKLPLADSWVLDKHLDIVRGLMFVLKDTPADQSAKPRIEAEALLELLISRVATNFKKEDLENPQSKLYALDKVLVNDLPHVNQNTRQAAQKAYSLLAKALDMTIADIIKPVKELLLQPVFHKPLRLLALRHQIGYLDAMTFCMRLEGTKIIPTDDPLQRLFLEAMVLLDADDDNLAKQPNEFRTAESLVQLRIACMKLLSTAITNPEYQVTTLSNTWNKIICVFFRCLYVKSLEVVSAANDALKSVITVNSKLPKDVLQNGLRPILQSLQFPAKLTPDSLEGLARLLRLLTTYFKVEIGQRLLENSKSIADGLVTFKASFTLLETNKQMKVMAALFDVFHLLPQTANQFLEKLVEKDMELETQLRRTMFSPFREPLIRYFNQYPKDTVEFFIPKLSNLQYGRFFAQIIGHQDASVVREALYNDSEKLFNAINSAPDDHDGLVTRVNVIHLSMAITKFPKTKDLLSKNESLRSALLQSGPILETALRDGERIVEKEMPQYESEPISGAIDGALKLPVEQAVDQLVDLLALHLSQTPTNTDLFYEIVNMITSDKIRLRPSLFQFIYHHMISADAKDQWKTLVLKCIHQYKKQSTSQKFKTFLFHHVVNPIFAMDVQTNWDTLFGESKGTKLVDRAMINILLDQFWRPGVSEAIDESSGYIDHARMELLQLTALLLKYHNNSLQETRKDIIMFGWHWIKLEDVVNKHAAYVVIAYFIRLFETPLKITMNVYNTLLRAHQNEARPLVTQALELLAPVLKKRLGNTEGSKAGLGLWARLPRRIIAEEMNNLQQLISIFNFFIRQPDLFYEARDQIAPAIIPNLMKVAQSNNEAKRISLNLVALIWGWEERSYKETFGSPMNSPKGTKRKLDGSPTDKSYTCVASEYSRLHLIRHLNHFISIVPERYPLPSLKLREDFHIPMHPPVAPSEVCKKAVTLLKNFLSPPFWTDVAFDTIIQKFAKPMLVKEKPEDEKPDAWNTRMMNTTQALRVFVNMRDDEWVMEHLMEMLEYITKALKADDQQFQDCIHWEGDGEDRTTPLFRRLIEVLPEAPTMEVDEPEETTATQFMKAIHVIIADALSSNHFIAAINILYTLSIARPKEVDQHTEAIIKAFNQLLKQHLTYQAASEKLSIVQNPTRQDQLQINLDAYDAEIQVQLIIKIVDILAARIEVLGEQRRPFLTTLASLVERSRNEAICLKVMNLLQSWVFNSDGVPTLKEKVAVLTKMLLFEQRPEMAPLLKQFLELVLRIFQDPKVTRTELTVRLEHPFLVGTRSLDVTLRNQFLSIFDKHISRTPNVRLQTLLCTQDWTPLGDSFWLSQVIHLLFGSFEMNSPVQLSKEDFKTMSPTTYFGGFEKDSRIADVMIDDQFENFMGEYRQFCSDVVDLKLKDILEPLVQLQHTDKELASKIWLAIFPIFWANVPKDEHSEFEGTLASVLAKDFHMRQLDSRPNCIQTLLEGVVRAKPRMKCPPHVVKFLAKTYDVWYVAAHYLEEAANVPLVDTPAVRESTLDALLDLYASLDETDMFYGTWRRRCQYVESNSALSYEQMGMWDRAQQMYEAAQVKARTGTIPFSQGEYSLWEDHSVVCAQKLQQWDILQEYAKHENFNDLFIEACWRNPENWASQNDREQYDSMIKAVSDALTPRRAFFAAFMAFLKMHHAKGETVMSDAMRDFNNSVDTAIQLSIRKWHQLPKTITNAHIPLLQNFQHLVELYDAQAITATLSTTTMANLSERSQDLKMMFATWRDRLPNFWDDINAWQDLVTWRTHVFTLVNNTFIPIIQPNIQSNPSNPTAAYSFAYRGFHEMAWIINRFAHVARQHNLPDVCISQLGKIYTLPNIEIQEAFIKLREQAKCHYQNKGELTSGLDVIMNTNLSYFSPTQKSEFYTLKGMFLNKLDKKAEANEAFGSALYFDIRQAKAWREWAKYSDQLFKEDPKDLTKAANAISCYLEAASCYKNKKARPLLGRVLWLLSLDNADKVCAQAFKAFKNEQPLWYWISYVPQLLLGLSRQEAFICAALLDNIAKQYPQALFFQLRTSKEDLVQIKKQQDAREAREKEAKAKAAGQDPKAPSAQEQKPGGQASPTPGAASANGTPAPAASQTPQPSQGSPVIKQENKESTSRPGTSGSQNGTTDGANGQANGSAQPSTPKVANKDEIAVPGSGSNNLVDEPEVPLKPWEYVEKVMGTLKASHPFLSWSLESIGDQITKYFKPLPDEDAHRLIVALLNDSLNYLGRTPALYGNDNKLPPATEHNISKFTENVCPPHIRQAFFNDFVKIKPTMYEYVQKLRRWRSRFEERLDRRRSTVNLEQLSVHLADFKFTRLEEVEIPGQYLEHRDKNTDFVKIDRFLPDVDLVRGPTNTYRRIKIRGHDGSIHAFAVQTPTNRFSRREERLLQLLRLFNDQLDKSRETRRRNLKFNLPAMVPVSPSFRLLQDDASYISLQSVYEDWCRRVEVQKDDPILFQIEKQRAIGQLGIAIPNGTNTGTPQNASQKQHLEQINTVKLDTYLFVTDSMVPSTVALEYFQAIFPSFADFWLFRKTFAAQYAALIFTTYALFMGGRTPNKLMISRGSGKVWGTDLVPSMGQQRPVLHSSEPVPFRFTPSLQMLIGPLTTEGVFAPALQAVARALTVESGIETGPSTGGGQSQQSSSTGSFLEQVLALFIRDECHFWLSNQRQVLSSLPENAMREMVAVNAEQVIRRAMSLAQFPEANNLPAIQTVVDLIGTAVSPRNLSLTEPMWMGWL